jgi:hypothetical protein
MMSRETVLRTLFGELRSPGLIDLRPLHKELKLLGLSATDDELLALKAIAESVLNLDEAIALVKETGDKRLEEIAQQQAEVMAENKFKADEKHRLEKETQARRANEKKAADERAAMARKDELTRIENQKKAEAEAHRNSRLALKFSNPATYISNYEILKDPTAYGLEKKVKDAIEAGWTPLGGVCTYPMFAKVGFTAQDLFYQSMVKHDYMK